MFTVDGLTQLAEITRLGRRVYLRYSHGPEADALHPSTDHESGLRMPGLSANPLAVPRWWSLDTRDWLARRVCQYLREVEEGARPWILYGEPVDFGPDNEPLLVDITPIAWLSADLVAEAHARYHSRLRAGATTHRD